MTDLVIPWVAGMLHDRTVYAVAGVAHRKVQLDPDDVGGYARLLCDLWEAGEDWAVLEQDVEPPPLFLAGFDSCPQPWCIHSPERLAGSAWLGCVRFRGELCRSVPGLMRAALGDNIADGDVPFTWQKCDIRLERHLRGLGLAPHFHEPPAVHLHVYDRPRCQFVTSVTVDSPYGPREVELRCTSYVHDGAHTDERGQPFG